MVNPWYMDSDRASQALAQAADDQTRADAARLVEQGFVVLENSVTSTMCDAAVDAFRGFEKRHLDLLGPHLDSEGHYPRLVNLHLAIPELRSLFCENERALRVQDLLFGAETTLYTSLFYERGSAQDIHRDTPYFCTRPEYRYFGMWVALEDVDEENGPLMVMQGGHQLPELDREEIAAELFGSPEAAPAHSDLLWATYQGRVTEQGNAQGLKIRTLPVSKGTTILWHPQLPHGGAPIRDFRRTRFSLVMHTTPHDTPVYYQDAFFNPSKRLPESAPWPYEEAGGRRYAQHGSISFGHAADHSLELFGQEAAG